ncbi:MULTISPECIES: hypothetical protein [unclassified Streptomyces]|uniref:hypothetical protein n=1 Tax=unclassified Streptomyces TaxID=2593676 RepID=UPI002E17301F
MNDTSSQKKPPARRGTASRSTTRGETSAGGDRGKADEPTTVPGHQLDLPIQGTAVERRGGFYQPYLQKSGEYDVVGKPDEKGEYMDEPPPAEGYGSDVGDPAPSAGRDTRGWSCPPDGPCEWDGLV